MRDIKYRVECVSARINDLKVKLQVELAEITEIREEWFNRYEDAIMNDRMSEFAEDVTYLHGQLHSAEIAVDEAEGYLHSAEENLDEFVACVDDVVL